MDLNLLKPRKALNKAFLKVKANRNEIEIFKKNLIHLIDAIDENESEEFHKNLVSDFLKNTYYGSTHFINTKGHTDLVIHNSIHQKSTVGVVLEAKSPTNKTEMLKQNGINTKAFHELVLYYLRERITNKNLEIKHLLVTNIYEWYIFDANIFEKEFAQNKNLVKQFTDFEEGRLSGKTTDFFYKQIAEPAINTITHEITFTHFDIREYEKPLRNNDKKDDNILIALFKLLSPEHLLKLPFANDSNTLDKTFYTELLHLIGLAETKEGSKKVIERKKEGERNAGSLIESAIFQLDQLDKISRLEKPSQFGNTYQERIFNVALELSITWINRILFLKLLEAQLIKYHKGDKAYAFLNHQKIQNFDDLNNLFFSVLARKPHERNDEVKELFANVPYLNSSLFEPTNIEHSCLFISQLRDGKLPLLSTTVIKNNNGKKRTGSLNTLEYFFEFLDAYDFSSEGSEEIQEENKSLINASVLGLIFEKINGYKDGSFFTPGFITMYMSRETIRRAVVQKFNEVKNWNCTDINQLYDKIEDRKEANQIINSLKICDPAVGSGHFLVSSLNEIIAIKNDLKVLLDRDGKRLKEYHIEVENDELIVTDEDDKLFEYNPHSKENRRIQEALFHEKQTIIENCLFGVDINPNSVKICRLRLWIELLKNAYYKGPDYTELETLPNIDINIKCGNSLISRYTLDADIKKALRRSKWNITSYRLAVMTYRNAQSKDEKREMERLIAQIKNDFESEIATNDKRFLQLNKFKGELFELTNQNKLFELTKAEKTKWNNQVKEKTGKINLLETELEEIRQNKIYENAFEWRFEFPEVLNDDGDFTGFDVIIGNPPYIRQEEFSEFKPFFSDAYKTFNSIADLYVFFFEQGLNLLKQNGDFIFITPNKWIKTRYGKQLRNHVKNFSIKQLVDFGDLPVFEEATTYPSIIQIVKNTSAQFFEATHITTLNFKDTGLDGFVQANSIEVFYNELADDGWTLASGKVQMLLAKLRSKGKPLGDYVNNRIYRGILTGINEAFVISTEKRNELVAKDANSAKLIKPFLAGKDIKRFQQPMNKDWVIMIPKGFTIKRNLPVDSPDYIAEPMPRYGTMPDKEAWEWLSKNYPAIAEYLIVFKDKAVARTDQGDFWWELRACDYYGEFENSKIVWPETSSDNQFTLIEAGIYLNKTTFFIPGNNLFLLGLMNSTLAKFYLGSIVSKMRGGYFSLSKAYVETFPVALDTKIEEKIVTLVAEALAIKKQDPNSNTKGLEAEIDLLVYHLYDLTDEEIEIIK
jgi:adenine-specific DNA-methyltransferase